MNILVTVGTGDFDALIKVIDQKITVDKNKIELQIGYGQYLPKNYSYFRFSSSFKEKLKQADLIITHAGAATVFEALEQNKTCIVIPNVDRVNKHQLELAHYLTEHRYALVCHELTELAPMVKTISTVQLAPYTKQVFFKTEEIINYFNLPDVY